MAAGVPMPMAPNNTVANEANASVNLWKQSWNAQGFFLTLNKKTLFNLLVLKLANSEVPAFHGFCSEFDLPERRTDYTFLLSGKMILSRPSSFSLPFPEEKA